MVIPYYIVGTCMNYPKCPALINANTGSTAPARALQSAEQQAYEPFLRAENILRYDWDSPPPRRPPPLLGTIGI
jgi:hypothetical protein